MYSSSKDEYEVREFVDVLVKAGANLGGSDVESGFVPLIVQKAALAQDERAVRIWQKAGADVSEK